MSSEQLQALLIENQRKLENDIAELRKIMSTEHKDLAAKVNLLSDRISALEHQEKVTRWVFAVVGTVGGFLVREVLARYF